MTHLRFSISTIMAVVLVLALNLAAGDFYYGAPGMEWSTLIEFRRGAVEHPGRWIGQLLRELVSGRDGDRLFLTGFEVVGVSVLFLYIACAGVFAQSIHAGVCDLLVPDRLPR